MPFIVMALLQFCFKVPLKKHYFLKKMRLNPIENPKPDNNRVIIKG